VFGFGSATRFYLAVGATDLRKGFEGLFGLVVAAILSVIETCRRHQIPIRRYLSSVLPGLGEFPAKRVSELTPANWARHQS